MIKAITNFIGLLCSCIYLCFFSATANAQESVSNSVHWAYSAYFGTGWYQVYGGRDVYVLRMTPRWQLREPGIADDGKRSIGIDLRMPITTGLDTFDFDNIPGIANPDNLASLSVTPGVDVTFPVTEHWALRPFAALGWGKLLNNSESAWMYWTGLRSRYEFQNGKLDWALLNSITYVGYTPNAGSSEDFWPLMAGLEFDYPLGNYQLDDEQVFLSWHGTYTTFEENLDMVLEGSSVNAISDQWELGLSLHKGEGRIRIGWFSFNRLGLAYRFSSSGDLKGISFVFRSVFDQ
jgi:hypothetical protein